MGVGQGDLSKSSILGRPGSPRSGEAIPVGTAIRRRPARPDAARSGAHRDHLDRRPRIADPGRSSSVPGAIAPRVDEIADRDRPHGPPPNYPFHATIIDWPGSAPDDFLIDRIDVGPWRCHKIDGVHGLQPRQNRQDLSRGQGWSRLTTPLAAFPPELIARVAEQAARDADLTAHFLTAVGLGPPPGRARPLPGDFLLELGAAMRLLAWEVDGLDLHESGLPAARDAILQAFRDAARRARRPSLPGPVPRPVRLPHSPSSAWPGPGRGTSTPRSCSTSPTRTPWSRPWPDSSGTAAKPRRPMTGARRHERATRRRPRPVLHPRLRGALGPRPAAIRGLGAGPGDAARASPSTAPRTPITAMIERGLSAEGDLYLDYGISGNLLSRPGLDAFRRRALEDAGVTHLFVPRRDRIARPDNPLDALSIEFELRSAGLTLVLMDQVLAPLPRGKRDRPGRPPDRRDRLRLLGQVPPRPGREAHPRQDQAGRAGLLDRRRAGLRLPPLARRPRRHPQARAGGGRGRQDGRPPRGLAADGRGRAARGPPHPRPDRDDPRGADRPDAERRGDPLAQGRSRPPGRGRRRPQRRPVDAEHRQEHRDPPAPDRLLGVRQAGDGRPAPLHARPGRGP